MALYKEEPKMCTEEIIISSLKEGKSFDSICRDTCRPFEFILWCLRNIFDDKNNPDYDIVVKNVAMFYYKNVINDNRCLVMSDTHIGSDLEDLNAIDQTYEFAYKNGIKYIVHLGDLIEGFPGSHKKDIPIDSLEKQFEKLNAHIPKDGTYFYYLAGNHDINAFLHKEVGNGYHISKNIKQSEYIRYLSLQDSYIHFKNGGIVRLYHPSENWHFGWSPDLKDKADFLLEGHHHYYFNKDNNFYVPTVSNDLKNNDKYRKGFLVIENLDGAYKCDLYDLENKKEPELVKDETKLILKRNK